MSNISQLLPYRQNSLKALGVLSAPISVDPAGVKRFFGYCFCVVYSLNSVLFTAQVGGHGSGLTLQLAATGSKSWGM